MEIRKLNTNDYEKFLCLISQFRQTYFSKNCFEIMLKQMNNTDIWVIEDNNQLIATGTILYEYKFIYNISKVGHIEDICVHEKYRGKGHGKLLINHLINECKNNGCYKVTLDCLDDLEHFYKSCSLEKNGIQMSIKF